MIYHQSMSKIDHFKYYKTSPEIIKMAIMYYIRYPLSLRNVEDIPHERGIDICHETVRYWWNKLGPVVAKGLKKKRPRHASKWRWHIDEAYIRLSSLSRASLPRQNKWQTTLPLACHRPRGNRPRLLRYQKLSLIHISEPTRPY